MDIFKKCYDFYPTVKDAIDKGMYPYFIPLSSEPHRRVKINGRELIMLGSNNYLGLTVHPDVKREAMKAIEKYGTGCTGSRFLNGTLDIHVELERQLAEFVGKEAALVFSTGYQANLGTISAIVQKDDYVITDKLDHASIIDGCLLSQGTMKRFLHNDMDSLERVLKSIPKDAGKLIVVDGLFSMEGDIAPLPDIIEIARKYNARLMVDDAHAVGVLGKTGAGTAEHFGVTDQVDIIMGTFSKSFASIGGFIAGDREVIEFIKHNGRSMIFSASMAPSAVATVMAALKIIKEEPERREKLWKNTRKMLKGLREMGYDIGNSETPVIPLVIGDSTKTLLFWRELFDSGVFTNPVIPPAVPPNRSLIRTSYMATHTDEDLDQALEIFEKAGKKFGVIK